VATYIVLEAPVSGMSMNPARPLGSATFAQVWTALWIYFAAPAVGMLLASQGYLAVQGARAVKCAKRNHDTRERCIFRCRYGEETR
jgi:aquaporin Z